MRKNRNCLTNNKKKEDLSKITWKISTISKTLISTQPSLILLKSSSKSKFRMPHSSEMLKRLGVKVDFLKRKFMKIKMIMIGFVQTVSQKIF